MRYYTGWWTTTWLGQRALLVLRRLHWRWRTRRGIAVSWSLFHSMVRYRQYRESVKWDTYLKRDPCCYCFRYYPSKLMTIEHVEPQGRGGPDKSSNKVGCCKYCNHQRGALRLIIFLLKRQGRLPKRLHPDALRTEHRALDRYESGPLRTSLGDLARWR